MIRETDILLVGATYFSLGFASVHPGCTIIEAGQILGTDFHQSIRPADVSGIGERERTTLLARMMEAEQVWEKDRFDVLKAAPVLHKFVLELENPLDILLDARILSIESPGEGGIGAAGAEARDLKASGRAAKRPGSYLVKYRDNEGLHTLRCRKLLDTTMCRDTWPGGVVCTDKTLNVFTVSLSEDMEKKLKSVCPECEVIEGVKEGEKTVRFPIRPEEDALSAYRQVTELWKRAFPEGEEKILFAAEDFEYAMEERTDEKGPCPWHGRKYADPLTAFAAGTVYRIEEEKG